MADQNESYDIMMFELVLSLQGAAMTHMGKIASPVSGKVERNLEAAKHSIDLLEMFQRKSQGNLTSDEKRLLDHVLYELRLNYVDEVKKGDAPADPEPESGQSGA